MEIAEGMTVFTYQGEPVPGYLAQPVPGGRYPGVVLIQEWWGLVPHIKDVARRFARQGFVALAPDLYHGREASEPDEARKLAMELDREHAVSEIAAAVRYLQHWQAAEPRPVGIVGWCMGGSLAIATAATCEEVKATVAFYGMPRDLEQLPAMIMASPLRRWVNCNAGWSAMVRRTRFTSIRSRSTPFLTIRAQPFTIPRRQRMPGSARWPGSIDICVKAPSSITRSPSDQAGLGR